MDGVPVTMDPKCSKCGGSMIAGAILQKCDGLVVPIATWIDGEPQRTLLGSTQLPADGTRKIRSFRCNDCGFLELFAQ